jgi:hypothetical protein
MNKELKYAFITHVCKYLGIALVSGSIVHAGTLGGNSIKYIGLIIIGIFLTVLGNYLEYKIKNIKVGANILMLAILLSFGTGMLSGGIQHYADNPAYGSLLLSLGLILTFVSLSYKDFADVITKKSLGVMAIISLGAYLLLSTVGANLISGDSSSHHEVSKTTHQE